MYTGKDFEDDFKSSFDDDTSVLLTRLYDTTNGFAGVKNPCDFILYNLPYQMSLELKVTHDKRLAFQNVTPFQWKSLTERDNVLGMMAGLLICYYSEKRVFFVPMVVINQIRDAGLKSIHFIDAERYGIELTVNMKRKHFTVDVDKFMDDCQFYKYNFKITEVTRRG